MCASVSFSVLHVFLPRSGAMLTLEAGLAAPSSLPLWTPPHCIIQQVAGRDPRIRYSHLIFVFYAETLAWLDRSLPVEVSVCGLPSLLL